MSRFCRAVGAGAAPQASQRPVPAHTPTPDQSALGISRRPESPDEARLLDDIRRQERRRIACALHDGPARRLIECLYYLEACQHSTSEGDVAQQIQQASGAVRLSLDEMRKLIDQCRANSTQDSLNSSILSAVAEFRRYSNIELIVDLPTTLPRLPAGQAAVVRAAMDEALFNTWRHSGSSTVRLSATVSGGILSVSVHDNGKGVDPTRNALSSSSGSGIGLRGVSERAVAVGGRLSIHSQPGTGFLLTISFPLSEVIQASPAASSHA